MIKVEGRLDKEKSSIIIDSIPSDKKEIILEDNGDLKFFKFIPDTIYAGKNDEKMKKILLELPLSEESKEVLTLLFDDIGKEKNNDKINNLKVENLLTEIASYVEYFGEYFDVLILENQLKEMKTGNCVSGKTIRLYSVVFSFRNIIL